MRYFLVGVHERDDEGVEIGAVDIDHALSTDGMRDVTVTEVHMLGEGTQNYIFTAPKPGA